MATFEQYIELTIDRLAECRVRKVMFEGEWFWLTIASEPLLYGLGELAEAGLFDPRPDELWAGHLAYDFCDEGGFVDMNAQMAGDWHQIRYVYRPSSKTWKTVDRGRENRSMEVYSAGEDKKRAGGKHLFGYVNSRDKFAFRPMLVPLDRNGQWDKTFRDSVPDMELTYGGWLEVKYANQNERLASRVFGNHMPDSGIIPDFSIIPVNTTVRSIELVTQGEMLNPLAWRSLYNTLICTRRFMIPTTVEDMYRLGLVPTLGTEKAGIAS